MSFEQLREALENWPEGHLPAEPLEDSCQERLRQALLAKREDPHSVGERELTALIRQLLLEHELRSGVHTTIRVPRGAGWPSLPVWVLADMQAEVALERSVRLHASPWKPEWLAGQDLLTPIYRGDDRGQRVKQRVPADPFLSHFLGFSHYTCPGQREAIRAAFCSPPDSTLLINLPTGAGKSLVGLAPALASVRFEQGLSLIIVPTVALALDQAEQAKHIAEQQRIPLPDLLAWHGGLEDDQRKMIRSQIRSGTQGVLFASPESVMGSLRRVLYEVAERGGLRQFVMDEAHLISQWGDDFRPEFQAVAGMRCSLLSRSPRPFRTLLLTATLTEESLWTLRTLFDPNLQIISAIHLRPEPDCHVYRCQDKAERQRHLDELAVVLPRPFILYGFSREQVEEMHRHLHEDLGFRRVGMLHGGTPSTRREALVQQWRARELDVMVATSAFGLGIDQADVRAVVHACVPETVDRFYQEIGRGGRDGRSSLSLLMYLDSERKPAEQLGRRRIITIDLGLKRWGAMLATHRSDEHDPSLYRIDLRAQHEDITGDSDANVSWNLRTLIVMARAEMIELVSEPPPELQQHSGESEQEFTERRENVLDTYYHTAVVRPTGLDHRSASEWKAHIGPVRQKSKQAWEANRDRIREMLEDDASFCRIFKQIYTIPPNVYVQRRCGGCPGCRRDNAQSTAHRAPIPNAAIFKPPLDPQLRRRLGLTPEASLALVPYPPLPSTRQGSWFRQLFSVLSALVHQGICEIATAAPISSHKSYSSLYRDAPTRFILHTELGTLEDRSGHHIPRITVLPPDVQEVPQHLLSLDVPLHILLFPEDLSDPDLPHRKLVDTYPATPLHQFLVRLTQ